MKLDTIKGSKKLSKEELQEYLYFYGRNFKINSKKNYKRKEKYNRSYEM